MPSEFSLKSEVQSDHLIITTSGYINNTGGESILQEYLKHTQNGIQNIIINLNESKVVNSIGVSYLIEIIENLNEVGGNLYFTNLDAAVEKTFSIMGLFNFAEKTRTVDEALKKLGK